MLWHSTKESANHRASRNKTADGPPLRGPMALEQHNMKFRPLHDRVALRRVDSETKTSGGIIIPDTAAEKPQQGEVIAVGPGARGEDGKIVPLDLKKGDRVLFGKWSGTEVKIDGAELLIMKESDIMGVLAKLAQRSASLAAPAIPTLRTATSFKHTTGDFKWLPRKFAFPPMPASACCAASTSSPTR